MGGTPVPKGRAGRPSHKDGRDAHPTITIKIVIVSYLIFIPKITFVVRTEVRSQRAEGSPHYERNGFCYGYPQDTILLARAVLHLISTIDWRYQTKLKVLTPDPDRAMPFF
jgi:hypothetical protein